MVSLPRSSQGQPRFNFCEGHPSGRGIIIVADVGYNGAHGCCLLDLCILTDQPCMQKDIRIPKLCSQRQWLGRDRADFRQIELIGRQNLLWKREAIVENRGLQARTEAALVLCSYAEHNAGAEHCTGSGSVGAPPALNF